VAIEEHFSAPSINEADAGSIGRLRSVLGELANRLDDVGELRLRDMNAAGIDVQVLSQVAPGLHHLDPGIAVPLAVDANDMLADLVGQNSSRFAGFATLPIGDPIAAASELERTVHRHDFKGAMVNGHTRGRYLDDRSFWPVFECAHALDVPIYLHPTMPPPQVADVYYAPYAPSFAGAGWGFAVETGTHMLRLILSGLFDAFPRLKVILGHMGELLPYCLTRIDRWLTPDSAHLQRPVTDYIKQNVWITTAGAFDVPAFICASHSMGIDRILFSVDYPFDDNRSGVEFLGRLPISEHDRAKVAHVNADTLLGLTAAIPPEANER
jgi:predicted TIM-barrel fold metal-dependent hydrolase